MFAAIVLVVIGYFAYNNSSSFKNLFHAGVQPTFSSVPGSEFLKVPEGLEATIYAKSIPGARVMAFDSLGRMLVSETKEGKVVRLEDANKDGMLDPAVTLFSGLTSPHGLAFYQDPTSKKTYLYVSESQRVARYVYDVNSGRVASSSPEVIASFPAGGQNLTTTIAIGPKLRTNELVTGDRILPGFLTDIKLYMSVGSSCDACIENSWKRGAILESDPAGTYTAEYAGGLHNSLFFTFHPTTKEIWATDIGRENLGDKLPPDEINIINSEKKYGWPFCYGKQIRDKTFNPSNVTRTDIPQDCTKTTPSVIDIPAHSVPMGLAFITSPQWPTQWQNNLLVAYHGSWIGGSPVGYKVVRYVVDEKGNLSDSADFITGWISADKKSIIGQPVDLKFGPDGALYISDDGAGIIYRIQPKK